jgi:hypothetical protein
MALSCDLVIVSWFYIIIVSGLQDELEMRQKMIAESVYETQAKLRPVEHYLVEAECDWVEDDFKDSGRQVNELRQQQSIETQITILQHPVVSTAAIQSSIQVFIDFNPL